ncbi:intradiol ring-cleavage dioxygenase, C-terminal domain containing protein [Pseudohyphozyma bogoriensis]|nr:intradiol ring-cleavage dioxygenase, C-terminal domain containing protein [Pseudohyphozyma bogoriensis]
MKVSSVLLAVSSLVAAVAGPSPLLPPAVLDQPLTPPPSLLLPPPAHEETRTPEELRALHETAYHCAPKIKAYVEQRKRAAQQALGSIPSTDASTMFLDNAFETAADNGKTILECTAAEEAKIRNHTCVLAPEVTQGPYYHTYGHPIRQNMAEDQLGLLFLMDVGVIDVNTCEPVPNVLVDLWHANTTGHYAGHADPDPDLVWEGPAPYGVRKGLLTKFPRWNFHETWLRGAWPTNKNGVSSFTSIFPGYYTGRATHVHVKIVPEWTPLANGTYEMGRLVHTGQFFVEDHINEIVDKIHPYTENPIKNKWGRTRNWEDSLKIYPDSHQNGYQPTFEIEKLGGVIQQGLIGYITVGVDMTKNYDRSATQQSSGMTHAD